MGLRKRTYIDRETVITAESLNDIQDAILDLEDGLFSVDNDKSGEVISITDAAKRGFRSLNIYGKTTQDGTPTPDAPVELVNIGNSGSITVNVTGEKEAQTLTVSTPNGLPGIPVDSGGNYTDANGQQWICDEIDFAKGVYVQRVKDYICTGAEAWETSNIQSPNLSPAGLIRYDAIPYPRQPRALVPDVLSEHCLFAGANMYDKDSGMSVWVNNDTDYLSMRIAVNFETPETLKNWLAEQYSAGVPLTILYALKTPIETPLSKEELVAYADMHTYRDNTTVSNDAGAYMELEYVMDAKKYIDSVIAGTIVPATVEE